MPLSVFQRWLLEEGIDAALFINMGSIAENYDLSYFTGYNGMGALVIPCNKRPFLLVPKMELTKAKRCFLRNVYVMDKKKLFEEVARICKKEKVKFKTLGLCFSSFSLAAHHALRKQFPGVRVRDVGKKFDAIRSIKTVREIKTLKRAFSIANTIYQKMLRNFKHFKSENDAAAFMEYEARLEGCALSFPPIVASGRNASIPHHFETERKLNRGLCVIDFGIRYRNYCTDMTRTVAIGGPTHEEEQSYKELLGIQKRLIMDATIGASCKSLYQKCNLLLGKKQIYFTHSLGHGIGVRLHELPNLGPNSEDVLKKGMVCTIEPGIYIPNKYGIRIEDSIIIGKRPMILTTPTKELLHVK